MKSKEIEKSHLESKMVSKTAPRQTMIFVYSSQHPLSSHFCQPQSKQPNRSVTTMWFGKLRQFFAPELPPCLISLFIQIANTWVLKWWVQKKYLS